jgi:hypothetical protein
MAAGVLAVGSITLAIKAMSNFAKAKAVDEETKPNKPTAPRRPTASDDAPAGAGDDSASDETAPGERPADESPEETT